MTIAPTMTDTNPVSVAAMAIAISELAPTMPIMEAVKLAQGLAERGYMIPPF